MQLTVRLEEIGLLNGTEAERKRKKNVVPQCAYTGLICSESCI